MHPFSLPIIGGENLKIYKDGHYKNINDREYPKYEGMGYTEVKTLPDHEVEEQPEVELTKKEIMALLDEQGIEYNARQNKVELLELLDGEAE